LGLFTLILSSFGASLGGLGGTIFLSEEARRFKLPLVDIYNALFQFGTAAVDIIFEKILRLPNRRLVWHTQFLTCMTATLNRIQKNFIL